MDTVARKLSPSSPAARFGTLLREWRTTRRLSQLDLALAANISPRHLSCVETGKSHPSRDMVLRLADALDMPLRERNALMVAAGYAPKYPETALDTPALAQVNRAIEYMLKQQEPYPAFLLNRHWDILQANRAAERIANFVLRGATSPHRNMIRSIFDPNDLRSAIVNWEDVAGDLIRHLHDAVANTPSDSVARALLDEALAYPGVPMQWRVRDPGIAPSPLLTTIFRVDGQQINFFSTITTFGTPRDVTLDDLHIESTFPMDEATAEFCRKLARDDLDAG
ncbi:helix-turn-helix domain-containing protein [Dyella mobilis]|uniref:Helix-turn-helix transcriptional regulator n=1 Tax=Dyella mobilis TaxID=1849582 RepID=A0ABS2KGB8_9GAMM|nr:helix-turn-helix transcriptional regulator [Dyella mobilis]MBM7130217.1 helix-turn-helix transcriptional regulator [Dyella mobilis]GLQ96842.1 transcriptional regulator [Dyella mobilis]